MNKDLQVLLEQHRPWLVITGAGISAASGIPTYRDASGTWQRSAPIQHREFIQDESKRKRYWARSALGWPAINQAEPNLVHHALVELEQQGLLSGVITQNVDRLHQKAGQQNVIDLHGRLDKVKCLNCNHYEDRDQLQLRILANNPFLNDIQATIGPDGDADVEDTLTQNIQLVDCKQCQGILMPDVVFYGGTIGKQTHQATAEMYARSAGLLILGSSLMVYSSYRFCKQAKQDGKPIAIINRGTTRADALADYKWDQDCESIVSLLSE